MDQIFDNNNSYQSDNNQNNETLSQNNNNELMNNNNDSSRFKCNDCDNVFLTEYQFKKHMKFRHTRKYPYKCKICDYACDRLNVFNTHMNVHNKDKPHKCPNCKFETVHPHSLKLHLKSFHQLTEKIYSEGKLYKSTYMPKKQEETKLKCDHCPFTCYINKDMMKHKKQIHKIKQHKCPHCSYESDLRKNFNVHMKIHSGEKPFKCEMCDRASRRKYDILQHRKLAHSLTEDSYICPVKDRAVDNVADNFENNENEEADNFVEEDETRIGGKVEDEEEEDDDPVMKPPAAKKARICEN